jgi:hypothetical protein
LVLRREPELAAALQQAAAERALLRAELDDARCELRVTQRQLEVRLLCIQLPDSPDAG